MEIHHHPERPIHSTREFLLALTTITIGILIAMSLEGILTWAHHRVLVREAKARLTEELSGNRREVADFLKTVPGLKESNERVLRFIEDVAEKKLPKGTTAISSSYSLMSLARTSWETAHATGALAYMDYGDAQKYAEVYSQQARLDQLQDRLLDYYISGLISFQDPDKATPQDLQQWRQNVVRVSQYVDAERQLVEALLKEYDKILK